MQANNINRGQCIEITAPQTHTHTQFIGRNDEKNQFKIYRCKGKNTFSFSISVPVNCNYDFILNFWNLHFFFFFVVCAMVINLTRKKIKLKLKILLLEIKRAEQLAVVSKNGQLRNTPKIVRYFSQCLVLHFAPSNKSIEPKQITIIFICFCMCLCVCVSAAPKIPTITFQLK